MDETLLEAYRKTRYLVCVDCVEWAEIRIDQPLPAALQQLVGAACWGFITAWNPLSLARADSLNQIAQRALCAVLNTLPETRVLPAIGIGPDGWIEPSLFATGPSPADLDVLGTEHEQNAYVHGQGTGLAQLRLLQP